MKTDNQEKGDAEVAPAPALANPPPRPAGPLGKPTGWRKLLYRVAAVTIVPTMLLSLLELGLWAFGYGYPTSFFLVRPGPGAKDTIYGENVDFGRRFFPRGRCRNRSRWPCRG